MVDKLVKFTNYRPTFKEGRIAMASAELHEYHAQYQSKYLILVSLEMAVNLSINSSQGAPR